MSRTLALLHHAQELRRQRHAEMTMSAPEAAAAGHELTLHGREETHTFDANKAVVYVSSAAAVILFVMCVALMQALHKNTAAIMDLSVKTETMTGHLDTSAQKIETLTATVQALRAGLDATNAELKNKDGMIAEARAQIEISRSRMQEIQEKNAELASAFESLRADILNVRLRAQQGPYTTDATVVPGQ